MKYKVGDRVYYQNKKYELTGVFRVGGLTYVAIHGLGFTPEVNVKPIITCK